MLEFIKAKKNYVVAIAVLFVFISLSETTYSLFLKQDSTEEFNYNTGSLDLEFITDEMIVLDNVFPMVDSVGENGKVFKLTIKNTGTLPHLFDLKMLSDGSADSIDYKYIKVKVNDYLATSLAKNDNVIAKDLLIYPGEELYLSIRLWLDNDTPNQELGKKFTAKLVSSGIATYRTSDNSGANHPELKSDMFPVLYDEDNQVWRLADKSNNNDSYRWYNYSNQKWANAVTLNDSEKIIFDDLRGNDLGGNGYKYNNGNIIIDDKYLDCKLQSYNYDAITNIIRVKFNDVKDNYSYILSNGNISYYYDNYQNKFIFKTTNGVVESSQFKIDKDKWYIIGYTYDMNKVEFYVNGDKVGEGNIDGRIGSGSSFKLGTDESFKIVSKLTVGSLLTYYKVLSSSVFSNNFRSSINVLSEGLVAAYTDFTPLTLREYYKTRDNGVVIKNEDINSFYVWIPRFKYMLFNVMGDNTDSYDAFNNGITIMFEKGTNNTGSITYKDGVYYGDTLALTEVSSNDNGKYYTHPAFSTNKGEIPGFWISKYEVSTTNSSCNNDINNCNRNDLDIVSRPKNSSWRNNMLGNYYQAVSQMDGKYHIIKNSEWGAVAYLSHSIYGVCPNNKCSSLSSNKTYIAGNELFDSTTKNIYGVFDMSGASREITMSNYADSNNEINITGNSFNGIPLSNDDYELYSYGKNILGSAIMETTSNDGIWYGFGTGNNEVISNWIVRGGNKDNDMGLYAYASVDDNKYEDISTRLVIR